MSRIPWLVVVGSFGCASPPPVAEPRLPAWYLDADGDGFGDPEQQVRAEVAPPSFVLPPGDCNDADPAIYPNAHEIPNDGIDQDCSGTDATCESRAAYPTDMLFSGFRAAADINAFCRAFSSVEGTVTVTETGWKDLLPLSCLCSMGSLVVENNALLTQTESLRSIALTHEAAVLRIRDNPIEHLTLPDALGPDTVVEIQGSDIASMDGLATTSRLAWFEIRDSPALALPAAPALVEVGMLRLIRVDATNTLEGFAQLTTVDELHLEGLPRLRALHGLASLGHTQVVLLHDVPIESAAPLGGLGQVEMLSLRGAELPDLTSLGSLVPERLHIQSAHALISLEGFPAVDTFGELVLDDVPNLADLRELAELRSVEQDLRVHTSRPRSLEGLEQLESVGGHLWIESNQRLADLDALWSLRHVGGDLVVLDNPDLADVTSLMRLHEVGGQVYVRGPSLPPGIEQSIRHAIDLNGATNP